MREIFTTLDPVTVSFFRTALAEEGIETLLLDTNMSALYAGNSLFPQRIMVADHDYEAAQAILEQLKEEIDL